MTDTADIRSAIHDLRAHTTGGGYSLSLGDMVETVADELDKVLRRHGEEVHVLELGKEGLRAECERLNRITRPEPTTDTIDICSAIDNLKTYATNIRNREAGCMVDRIADELGRLVNGHSGEASRMNKEIYDHAQEVKELKLKLDGQVCSLGERGEKIDSLQEKLDQSVWDLGRMTTDRDCAKEALKRSKVASNEIHVQWVAEVKESTRLELELDRDTIGVGEKWAGMERDLRETVLEQDKKIVHLTNSLQAANHDKAYLKDRCSERYDDIAYLTESASILAKSMVDLRDNFDSKHGGEGK